VTKWLYILLSFLVFFLSTCATSNTAYSDDRDIPIILIFPNEEVRAQYEQIYLDMIEHANELIQEPYFYVDNILVKEFDVDIFSPFLNGEDYGQYKKAIPVYAVNSIWDGNIEYSGIAWNDGKKCEEFIAIVYSQCSEKLIRCRSSDLIVAHELGHAFGLGHDDDDYNIMFPLLPTPEAEFEQWQQDIMKESGIDYSHICL
jgi:hypothetical protein